MLNSFNNGGCTYPVSLKTKHVSYECVAHLLTWAVTPPNLTALLVVKVVLPLLLLIVSCVHLPLCRGFWGGAAVGRELDSSPAGHAAVHERDQQRQLQEGRL